ncbi:DUF5816 domain-containing protein [Halorientalis halophila]|uniref:DUF5816 domain-containing protein n=1 Tax=Halorientalis halophila TaxID=3108499 RepID=UPI00300AA6B8
MEARTTEDGEQLYVATEEAERGSKGPFFVVYTTQERADRWGYFCANCETFDNAMDSMGRIQCNVCSNIRKADEWDAAHE